MDITMWIHLFVKVDYPMGERGVSSGFELELIQLLRKAVIIHEQWILVPIIRY
jgi:hypothetical protein